MKLINSILIVNFPGNTCRSPVAEAVFIDEVKKAGLENEWEIDSAAITDWHVGDSPNKRASALMEKYKLAYDNRARQIEPSDFRKFDYIFGMDGYNMYDLDGMAPSDGKAKLLLLGSFDPEGFREIRDPYCVSVKDHYRPISTNFHYHFSQTFTGFEFARL